MRNTPTKSGLIITVSATGFVITNIHDKENICLFCTADIDEAKLKLKELEMGVSN